MFVTPPLLRQRLLAAVLLIAATAPVSRADERRFREQIGPIFQRHCVTCHNAADRKGGLSLQTAEAAMAGGRAGAAIYAGDPDSSYLLDMVAPYDGEAEMPKGAPPLSGDEVATLRQWIEQGAEWPEEVVLERAPWWSLQPLERPPLPELPAPRADWVRTPIDTFIAAKQAELDLRPAAEADRRTLIRRLYFDLIGLPPTPEEIEAFAGDSDPRAYEQLVERLLASPHYGERWARHWLDVVHYGETHGYDKDQPRPNAWPYRDYVVRSFNEDKPYARFVQEQIAGDILFPGTPDGIEALGFLAAGPWDLIGHAEVPESKIDGKIARHLDRDDMVQNTMLTFMSLTVGCAQCHDHKFDPISQEEYYRLQAVFAALDRTDKPYDADPDRMRQRQTLSEQQRTLIEQREQLNARIQQLAGSDLSELDQKIAIAARPADALPPQHGYHSAIATDPDQEKWVQIDLEEETTIDRLEYIACHDDFNGIGSGFGFPVRFKIELSSDPDFQSDVHLVVDQTGEDFPNPGTQPQAVQVDGQAARFVRFTATRLAHRQQDYIFALAELKVLDAEGDNRAGDKSVTALDSIEAPIRWTKSNLVNGIYPAAAVDGEALAALKDQRRGLLEQMLDEPTRQVHQQIERELAEVEEQLGQLPPPRQVYAATIHSGEGNFRGTGADGGRPRPIHLLHRGDVTNPGPEVEPAALDCIENLPGDFGLAEDDPEGLRRAALARWLTDPRNPLPWRSIVNRLWQYHFGRGLVDSPNDFGRMGQLPTHPQLLDWLAAEFRDSGQSFKQLHRMIVHSATYRQASEGNPRYEEIDSDNAYYWRMNRRRLEAEAIRDSMLHVADKLDMRIGGPSFQDFVIEKPEHSPHYQYHLHDPEDPRSQRRSIYRFLVRSQTQPFMTVFDCADPSILVDKRNQTTTPLQALALMNNSLTLVMARHFAARVDAAGGDLPEKVAHAFRLAMGRPPSDAELSGLCEYAERHGLENTCRAIINLNEFVLID